MQKIAIGVSGPKARCRDCGLRINPTTLKDGGLCAACCRLHCPACGLRLSDEGSQGVKLNERILHVQCAQAFGLHAVDALPSLPIYSPLPDGTFEEVPASPASVASNSRIPQADVAPQLESYGHMHLSGVPTWDSLERALDAQALLVAEEAFESWHAGLCAEDQRTSLDEMLLVDDGFEWEEGADDLARCASADSPPYLQHPSLQGRIAAALGATLLSSNSDGSAAALAAACRFAAEADGASMLRLVSTLHDGPSGADSLSPTAQACGVQPSDVTSGSRSSNSSSSREPGAPSVASSSSRVYLGGMAAAAGGEQSKGWPQTAAMSIPAAAAAAPLTPAALAAAAMRSSSVPSAALGLLPSPVFASRSLEGIVHRMRAVGLLRERPVPGTLRFRARSAVCLVGRQLVDYLCTVRQARSRDEALAIGRALVACGFIAPVPGTTAVPAASAAAAAGPAGSSGASGSSAAAAAAAANAAALAASVDFDGRDTALYTLTIQPHPDGTGFLLPAGAPAALAAFAAQQQAAAAAVVAAQAAAAAAAAEAANAAALRATQAASSALASAAGSSSRGVRVASGGAAAAASGSATGGRYAHAGSAAASTGGMGSAAPGTLAPSVVASSHAALAAAAPSPSMGAGTTSGVGAVLSASVSGIASFLSPRRSFFFGSAGSGSGGGAAGVGSGGSHGAAGSSSSSRRDKASSGGSGGSVAASAPALAVPGSSAGAAGSSSSTSSVPGLAGGSGASPGMGAEAGEAVGGKSLSAATASRDSRARNGSGAGSAAASLVDPDAAAFGLTDGPSPAPSPALASGPAGGLLLHGSVSASDFANMSMAGSMTRSMTHGASRLAGGDGSSDGGDRDGPRSSVDASPIERGLVRPGYAGMPSHGDARAAAAGFAGSPPASAALPLRSNTPAAAAAPSHGAAPGTDISDVDSAALSPSLALSSRDVVARGLALESRLLRAGWLMKQGHRFKTWKRRFFVLRGPELAYYRKGPPAEAASLFNAAVPSSGHRGAGTGSSTGGSIAAAAAAPGMLSGAAAAAYSDIDGGVSVPAGTLAAALGGQGPARVVDLRRFRIERVSTKQSQHAVRLVRRDGALAAAPPPGGVTVLATSDGPAFMAALAAAASAAAGASTGGSGSTSASGGASAGGAGGSSGRPATAASLGTVAAAAATPADEALPAVSSSGEQFAAAADYLMYADSEADALAWFEALCRTVADFAALRAAAERVERSSRADLLRSLSGLGGTAATTDSLLGQ